MAEVAGVDPINGALHVRRGNGQQLQLPLTRPLTIDYGYAATAHSSQGATVDRVLVDIDTRSLTTNDAAYYVEISRARHEAKIYTNDRTKLPEAVQRVNNKTAALDVANVKQLDKTLPQVAVVRQQQRAPEVQRDR